MQLQELETIKCDKRNEGQTDIKSEIFSYLDVFLKTRYTVIHGHHCKSLKDGHVSIHKNMFRHSETITYIKN